MYNTSKGYKEKILEDSTQHELNIYIDGNKIEPNHIIDFSSKSELFNNNELCLGCTPEKDIEFEIDKRDLPENYNEVYVETGIKYHNDIVTEGEEITLKEEKEIPLNLEISGNHKQKTYSGKNMYPLPNEQTINGIKVSHNKDGTFNLIGTATAETYIVISTTNILNDKKVYTISKNTTNIAMVGYEYNINTWLQTFVIIGKSEKSKTFTYNKNSNMTRNILQINIANGTVLNETNIKIMLKENSNETEWEPYVGGIPAPNPDYPSEIKTVGNNVNLLNYNKLTDKAINVGIKIDSNDNVYCSTNSDSREWNYNNSNWYVTLLPGTYTISLLYSKQTSSTNGGIGIYSQSKQIVFKSTQNIDNYNYTFTLTEETQIGIMIKVYGGIFKIKLVEGTEVGEYSKYGQGTVKVTKCNKNLLDFTKLTENYSWQCTEIIDNGIIKLTSTSSNGVSFSRFNNNLVLDTNKTYTITATSSSDFGGFRIFYPVLGEYSDLGEKFLTFKPKESIVRLVFYVKINKNCTISDIQLEEGSTATTRETHQEQSYIIPTQQEMLKGDYFDWDNEEEVHTWNKFVMNGTDGFGIAGEFSGDFIGIYSKETKVNSLNIKKGSMLLSRKFRQLEKNTNNECMFMSGTENYADKMICIGIKKSRLETEDLAGINKYFSENPTEIYYQTTEKVRLPFTEEQKEIAKELSHATTYEGTTHIYSTDSISPILKTTCGSEIVPIGKFTIQKPIEDDEFKVKIKATDYMKKFEDNKYDGSNLTYPKTMVEVLKDICIKVGVELGSTSFLNSDKQIAVYDNTVTARTYLGYIAEQAGGFAVIGRDGKLYIKTFGEDTINFNIDLFGDFTWGDKLKVSRVSYEDGIQNYKFGDETQATVFIDQNNMYIVDSEQVENIYNQIKDFEVYTFEGETIIDPAYDIGDILVIDGKKVLYQGEIKYAGKFKASINNKVQAKTEQESMQTKQTNSNKIKRVQSEINQIDGKITQLVQETTENEEKITQAQQDIDGFTQKVATKDELTEKVNELKHTIEGITLQAKETGGGNIFFYAKEYWRGQTQDSEATLEEYTDTLIQQNNVSDEGYLINNGVSIQSQVVKNGQYVISFNYYKLKTNASGYVKINEVEYKLDGETNNWIEKIIPVEITSNNIKIEIGSDTVASYYISDLMVSMGVEKNIWTQNANETRTDTVEIGKGIQVNSSTKNTYTRIDADGNRTFNSSTNERVAEMTDKGVYTKQLEVKEQAKINVLLIQQIGSQVWLTGLGG